MSKQDKELLERQKTLLEQMDSTQKLLTMVYLDGVMTGKELAMKKIATDCPRKLGG